MEQSGFKIVLYKNDEEISETPENINPQSLNDIWEILEAMDLVSKRNDKPSAIVHQRKPRKNRRGKSKRSRGYQHTLGSSLESFPDQFLSNNPNATCEVRGNFFIDNNGITLHQVDETTKNAETPRPKLVVNNGIIERSERRAELRLVNA